jgi:hypothetical protein
MKAKKIQWWREPEFTRRRLEPPEIPQLLVEIPMDDGATEIGRKPARPSLQALTAAND